MKRGQSALEYLVTYGWAILAIVIIGGVLWYFGIFNPSQFAGDKQCGGFAAFTCGDFKVSTAGTLTISLNNKVGGSINTVAANLGGAGSTACVPATMGANDKTTCTLASFVAAASSGSTYDRTSFNVTYTDVRSGVTHVDGGFVRGKYE